MNAKPVPAGRDDSRMPSWLPRVNKLVINRIQGMWAPYIPPYAMVIHKGRRSGASYRTPVWAYRSGDELIIAIPYGQGSDWIRNLRAAGQGEVIRAGRRYTLTDIRITDNRSLGAAAPRPLRRTVGSVQLLIARATPVDR
jgi:deazaflavin-dependent oxidoreductase (nitroreductase family)